MTTTETDHPALIAELTDGTLELVGRITQASNATYLGTLTTESAELSCVYKPFAGERPLWDFPEHTLGSREVAAYEVSRLGGFDVVPVTVLADGPMGTGSLQVWVDSVDEEVEALVDLVPSTQIPDQGWFTCVEGMGPHDEPVAVIHADSPLLRRMAIFDIVVNNADRKGGHILASQGRAFGVDHGICFHTENKLRTLLWGWAGQRLRDDELEMVAQARDRAPERLATLLADDEVEAFVRRADRLISRGRFPRPHGEWPNIPWPPF